MKHFLIIAAVLCLAFVGRAWAQEPVLAVEYAYTGGTVPPPYHRSYTINITDMQLKLSVSDYQQVLHDTTVTLHDTELKNLKKLFGAILKKKNAVGKSNPRMIGGWRRHLVVQLLKGGFCDYSWNASARVNKAVTTATDYLLTLTPFLSDFMKVDEK